MENVGKLGSGGNWDRGWGDPLDKGPEGISEETWLVRQESPGRKWEPVL